MTVEQYALLLNFENQDQSTIGELAGRSGVSVPMLIKALRGLLDGNVLNCSEQVKILPTKKINHPIKFPNGLIKNFLNYFSYWMIVIVPEKGLSSVPLFS